VLVELFLQLLQRMNILKALGVGGLGIAVWARIDRKRGHRQRKQVTRKVGVKYQQCLAWDAERQFHAREDHKPPLLHERRATLISLLLGGAADISYKRHVMVIGDRDALQPAASTSLDQLTGVGQTLVVRNGIASRPIMVTRRMHLQITTVKMRSLVHRLPKTLLVSSRPKRICEKYVYPGHPC